MVKAPEWMLLPAICTRETWNCIEISLRRDAVALSMLAPTLFYGYATFDRSMKEPVRNGVQVVRDVNSANAQRPALGHWAIPLLHHLIQADRPYQSS